MAIKTPPFRRVFTCPDGTLRVHAFSTYAGHSRERVRGFEVAVRLYAANHKNLPHWKVLGGFSSLIFHLYPSHGDPHWLAAAVCDSRTAPCEPLLDWLYENADRTRLDPGVVRGVIDEFVRRRRIPKKIPAS